ncbi:MAG: 4Fe-4S binding protein [Thermoguttaceae bacterium]
MKDDTKKSVRWTAWRPWFQLGFLLVWLDPWLLRLHFLCGPVFHCYSCPLATFACPIGVLANCSAIHVFPFAAVGTLVLIGAAFGSFVCGWACPFGFLQDLAAKAPTPKFTLPAWCGWIRLVVLVVLVLAVPYFWGEESPLFFCRICPAGALEGAVPNVVRQAVAGGPVIWPTAIKTAVLGVFLAAIFFTWRPWCSLLCPLGAIYGLFNRTSLLFLRFRKDLCGHCVDCRSLCADGGRPQQRVDGFRCVRCMECTDCKAVAVEHALVRWDAGHGGKPPRPAELREDGRD